MSMSLPSKSRHTASNGTPATGPQRGPVNSPLADRQEEAVIRRSVSVIGVYDVFLQYYGHDQALVVSQDHTPAY